jgi:type IV pilus assembly protein PilN
MIRINLLAGERRAAKAGGRSFQIGQKITVVGSLILVLAAVLIGWRYWSIRQEQARIASEIESARREETRLSEVLREVADFEARRGLLQQRVALIDELRRGQSAPVHMVDQISRALPEMTWLTSLKQEGYDVTMEGRCLSLTALSDFVGNLEASRYFKRPVEIVDSAVVSGAPGGRGGPAGPDLIRFVIKGTFQMAGIDVAKPASARPAAKGRGGN